MEEEIRVKPKTIVDVDSPSVSLTELGESIGVYEVFVDVRGEESVPDIAEGSLTSDACGSGNNRTLPASLLAEIKGKGASTNTNKSGVDVIPGRYKSVVAILVVLVCSFKCFEYSLPWVDHVRFSSCIVLVLQLIIWFRWNEIKRWHRGEFSISNSFTLLLYVLGFYCAAAITFVTVSLMFPATNAADNTWMNSITGLAMLLNGVRWYLDYAIPAQRRNQTDRKNSK